jgi:PKD repeat protein
MKKLIIILLALDYNLAMAQTADFELSVNQGCSPLEVSVTNKSTNSVTYRWEWGDGTSIVTSSQNSFLHIYNNFTSFAIGYKVKLIAYNTDSSNADTLNRIVAVYPLTHSDFGADVTAGCSPLTVNFMNASSGGQIFDWSFGDGNASSNSNPVHIFKNETGKDTTFLVRLVASNQYFCNDTSSIEVKVNPKAYSRFTADDTAGCSPFKVSFINNSPGTLQYFWSFGDGHTSVFRNPAYVFYNNTNKDTTFLVSLFVMNQYGCIDTFSSIEKVYPKAISSFAPDVNEGCSPLTISFNNNSAGGIENLWTFGDGYISNLVNPVHIFHNETYEDTAFHVQLLVANQYMCFDAYELSIKVFAKVKSAFLPNITEGISPMEIHLNNTSLGAVTYTWNFDDGQTSSDMNPSHTFINNTSNDKTYNLALTAISANNCTDTAFENIKVSPLVSHSVENYFSGSKIYPVPVIDNLKIENKSSIDKIELFSLQGVLIYHKYIFGSDQCLLNISNLKSGNYILKIIGKQFTDYMIIKKN